MEPLAGRTLPPAAVPWGEGSEASWGHRPTPSLGPMSGGGSIRGQGWSPLWAAGEVLVQAGEGAEGLAAGQQGRAAAGPRPHPLSQLGPVCWAPGLLCPHGGHCRLLSHRTCWGPRPTAAALRRPWAPTPSSDPPRARLRPGLPTQAALVLQPLWRAVPVATVPWKAPQPQVRESKWTGRAATRGEPAAVPRARAVRARGLWVLWRCSGGHCLLVHPATCFSLLWAVVSL